MKFDRNEYARQCKIVRNTPLYRASCPPDDELGSLRDSAIEDIAEDKLQEAIDDPDLMAEMILENDYDQEGFKEMCVALSAMMNVMINDEDYMNAQQFDARLAFTNAMQDFIEMKAKSLAEGQVDE